MVRDNSSGGNPHGSIGERPLRRWVEENQILLEVTLWGVQIVYWLVRLYFKAHAG